MSASDEARVLRHQLETLRAAVDRIGDDDHQTSAVVLARTVTVSSYPTGSGPRMIGVKALSLSVAETEGATPTLTVVGSAFYALCTASTLPAVGTNVLVEQVGGRWIAKT